MANPEHLNVLQRGVYVWNDWRDQNSTRPDLRTAYLPAANLRRYNLRNADFRGAVLLGADIAEADAREADFSHADVRFLSIKQTKLDGASFREARGVTRGMQRAVSPPVQRRRLLVIAAAVLVVGGLGCLAYSKYGHEADLGPVEEPPAVAAPPSIKKSSPINPAAIEDSLLNLQLPEGDLHQAEADGDVVTVRLDAEEVPEDSYLPVLGATCGALTSGNVLEYFREIRVLNRAGDAGWAFQNPRGCPLLVATEPALMRLAARADSRPFFSVTP